MIKYLDLVRIKSGFYEGCEGYVNEYSKPAIGIGIYKVKILQKTIEEIESNLELIKELKK